MTDEEIQAICAELCGYPRIVQRWRVPVGFEVCETVMGAFASEPEATAWAALHPYLDPGTPEPYEHTVEVPDFLNDLNATHELEATLTDDQYHGPFTDALCDAVCEGTPMIPVPTAGGGEVMMPATTARWYSPTARQRCKAVLQAVGRWTDSN